MKIFTQGLKPKSIFIITACTAVLLLANTFSVKAQTPTISIFQSYVILKLNGGGNTYYDLQATTGNPDFQGANLGVYGQAQTLVLAGAQNKTNKCDGGNVTGGNVFYRVYLVSAAPGAFGGGISLSWISNDGGTCGGDQTWEVSNNTTDVKVGLAAGVYKLEVYTNATGYPGTVYSNNGGNNFIATFTVTDIPIAYNVTGGGSYCTGGTGVLIGISGSENGVNYQLYNGASAVGSTVAGTGAALDFGLQTAIGTYTVKGTAADGTTDMTGSTVITETASLSSVTITPNAAQAFCGTASGTELTATETGGGAITTRQWGKRSEIGGTITDIVGATSQTYTPSGAALGIGIWYVVCTSTPTCGSATVSDEVRVTVNSIPSKPDINANNPTTFCIGGSVLLTSSTAGDSYLWSTGATTASITVSTSGSYTVQVTTGGCQSLSSDPTIVTVNPFPSAADAITGNSTVTQGDAGVAYSVPAISDATTYIWNYTGNGATITGTSENVTIAFSLSATSGDLTVKGKNSCGDGAISDVFPITVNPLTTPFQYSVTGSGTYCSSALGSVGLDGSQTGVSYQLYKDGISTGSPVSGTDYPIDFGPQPAGTYTVKGDNRYLADMLGSAIILVDIAPTGTAGPDDNAVVDVPYLLSGATASDYTTLVWSVVSGTGTFSDANLLHPTYTQSTPVGETATLRLTLSNGVCPDFVDDVILTMTSAVPGKFWVGGTGDWNEPTKWSDGSVPTITSDVFILAGGSAPTITTTAVCNSLDINTGIVTIASGGSLTVAGTLTNSVGAAGLVVKSGGSLIESTTDGVAATVERTIPTAGKWHYISAPNATTNSGMFTGNFLQSWAEPTHEWTYITVTNSTLNPVQGYSLYVKTGTPTYSFAGILNTGTQQYSGLTYNTGSANGNNGANFLGNPYPSSLDWAGLQGTYGAVYYYNGSGYVSYINGNGGGSQFVPPMQGFFIVANATMITNTGGKFTVSYSNRVHSSPHFYKSASAPKANSLVLATVGESYTDKLFVNFNPEATEGFDLQNDAYKFLAYTPGVSELYTYADDKKLSVDVRPEAQAIPIGFTNTLSGDYQIGIDQVADIPVVYLEDTKTGTFHDLLTGPYKFSYTAGENDKRFLLLFGTTGLKENRKDAATVYSYQKTVYINMADQALGDIFIYNIAGQQVASRLSAKGMNEIRLPNGGNYIVKVISKNNTVVRKVFILQ